MSTLDERIARAQLYLARKALANPEDDEDYIDWQRAKEAVAAATLDAQAKEAKWMAKVKPAWEDIRAKAGYCQCSRDGEVCSWSGCPQILDGEPEKSGRSCPLPQPGVDEL